MRGIIRNLALSWRVPRTLDTGYVFERNELLRKVLTPLAAPPGYPVHYSLLVELNLASSGPDMGDPVCVYERVEGRALLRPVAE